jgi:hypothetical protein
MIVLNAAISRSQFLSAIIGVTLAQNNPYAVGDAEIAGSHLKCAVRNAMGKPPAMDARIYQPTRRSSACAPSVLRALHPTFVEARDQLPNRRD